MQQWGLLLLLLLLLSLLHTHTHTRNLLISLRRPTLASQVREDPGGGTQIQMGMWVRSFIWKHLPGGLLSQPLLALQQVSGMLISPYVAVAIVCVSWHQWCGVTRGSTLDLLNPPLQDNEANPIRFLELGFDLISWASWEDVLQLGNSGRTERVTTVRCMVGMYRTHQHYVRWHHCAGIRLTGGLG